MKLRHLLGLFSLRHREPAACEACGGPFTCGAKLSGCWCSAISLSDETRAQLKARYRNCLCRECLGKAAASEALQPEAFEESVLCGSAAQPVRKGSAFPGTNSY